MCYCNKNLLLLGLCKVVMHVVWYIPGRSQTFKKARPLQVTATFGRIECLS